MAESFGTRLRRIREEQQIPLRTIADQTKIKMSLLEALERDDVSQWPAGIFRRAYIRSYARFIGMDPDLLVREFLEAHPNPEDAAAAAPAAEPAPGLESPGAPPTRLRSLMGAAIGSLSRFRRGHATDGPIVMEEAAVDFPAPDLPAPGRSLPADPEVKAAPPPARPPRPPRPSGPDFGAVARLATEFARVEGANDLKPLLADVARILDASGLIVWAWDARSASLRPAMVHGYSDQVLSQLPAVTRDADNATAAAFRLEETCAINGDEEANGALAIPLLTPNGCAGVLAIELRHGREQLESVRAAAGIFGALLAQLMPRPRRPDVQSPLETPVTAHRTGR